MARKQPQYLRGECPTADQAELISFVTYYGLILGYAFATVHVMLYSVRFAHVAECYPDPLKDTPLLTTAMKGLKRIQGGPQQKIPASMDLVTSAVSRLNLSVWDDLITATAILTMYTFLLRSGEALRKGRDPDQEKCLRVESVRLAGGGRLAEGDEVQRADEMILVIGRSKADQDGKGSVLKLFASDHPLCPVGLLKKAYAMRPRHFSRSSNFLFETDDGTVVRKDRVVDLLRQGAHSLGLPREALSAISLRSGGASAMWHAGCSIDEIKRRGRWASDCWRTYVWEGRERRRDLGASMLSSTFTLMASLARYERQARERAERAEREGAVAW